MPPVENGRTRILPLALCLVGLPLVACESKAVIASFSCPQTSESRQLGSGGAGSAGESTDSFALPWSTGFEYGLCDYEDGHGYCFTGGPAQTTLVTEPVHSGDYAAAFTVDTAGDGGQVRCVREGTLPAAAYYGAWYYLPVLAQSEGLWNLFHFQGDGEEHGGHLWDISIATNEDGTLRLAVFNYWLSLPDQLGNPQIPIGKWFHIEMYLKRATDETGEVIVYQDGVTIFQVTNVKTDNTSGWAQWYLGNLADKLTPINSTVYVDDVTIRETPSF